ncbi:MAG: stage III sporulation protein AD [Ruminococcaceae bacterium]|nr:stage III sporulation protein AD [Oscillospiraceae bacterium]
MDSAKLCLFGVAAVSVAVVIKKWNADFLPLVRLAATILFAGTILTMASPLTAYLKQLTETTGLSNYAGFLLKALGIAVLTQICADICRDAGESGIGNGVELAGKMEILILCLPLMGEIFSTAKALFAIGG